MSHKFHHPRPETLSGLPRKTKTLVACSQCGEPVDHPVSPKTIRVRDQLCTDCLECRDLNDPETFDKLANVDNDNEAGTRSEALNHYDVAYKASVEALDAPDRTKWINEAERPYARSKVTKRYDLSSEDMEGDNDNPHTSSDFTDYFDRIWSGN